MKVFTFGRAVRLAMLGGAIYYVKKHGGLKSTWNELADKMKPLAEQAKAKMTEVTQDLSQKTHEETQTQPPTGGSTGMPDFGGKGFGEKTGY